MKQKFIFWTLVLFTISAFAQMEQGKIRIGGSSNLGFSTYKLVEADYSSQSLSIDVHGGYFFIDNLSLDIGLNNGYSRYNSSEFGKGHVVRVGGGLGLRYYFPMKIFLGSSVDISYTFNRTFRYPLYYLNFVAGYAWFLSENVAFEPSINYHLDNIADGVIDIMRLRILMGISVYF